MARILSVVLLACGIASAASKGHVIGFGKPISAKWYVGPDEDHPVDLKIRALYVDSRLKEFAVGPAHDVSDHVFVVRQVFHLNDALSGEAEAPRWRWQRGGWLLVDRVTGHISAINLPEFDTYYSSASWYRDYVAYCGFGEDGKKAFAVVAQLGRRKAILKKPVDNVAVRDEKDHSVTTDLPDSGCEAPVWHRQPARITFVTKAGVATTYFIRGHDAGQAEENGDGNSQEDSQ